MFQNSECSATLNDELDGLSDAGTYIVDDEDIDEKTSISSFKQSVLRHDTFEIQGFLSSISHSTHVPHVNSIDTSSDKKPSIKPPESFGNKAETRSFSVISLFVFSHLTNI